MSLLSRFECPWCFGIAGWPGEQARRDPNRKHLACTCDAEAEQTILGHTADEWTVEVKELPNGRFRVAA
jgi:hypothetical protein